MEEFMTHSDLPDGAYAEWRGIILPAFSIVRPRWSVLLKWNQGEPAPEVFSPNKETGVYWATVPQTELTQRFRLRSYCIWNGQRCAVNDELPPGILQLTWIGSGNPDEAARLGFHPAWEHGMFLAAVPKDEVQDLHQERSEIPIQSNPKAD